VHLAGNNVEQEDRKRYTELDTITSIMQWQITIEQQFEGTLSSVKALDVWKYGLALRCASTGTQGSVLGWGTLYITKKSSLKERVMALAPIIKNDLDKLRLTSAHPILVSYSAFAKRIRFIKGFSNHAFEILRIEVWTRMAKAHITNTHVCLRCFVLSCVGSKRCLFQFCAV